MNASSQSMRAPRTHPRVIQANFDERICSCANAEIVAVVEHRVASTRPECDPR